MSDKKADSGLKKNVASKKKKKRSRFSLRRRKSSGKLSLQGSVSARVMFL